MAFKGFNSVLFEFDTVVDMKITLLNWFNLRHNAEIKYFDKSIIKTPIDILKYMRTTGERDILIHAANVTDKDDPIVRDTCRIILESAWKDFESDIINYSVFTDLTHLLRGYLVAGEGTIKGTVRCDTQAQADLILSKVSKDVPIIVSPRDKVDMGKYTRLIIGECNEVYQYKLYEPKSILVANYRENFSKDDITMLNPELVINLGDINDIGVVSVYRDETIPNG